MKQFLGKVKFWMDKFLSIACAVLLSFMTILVLIQVFSRYVLNSPVAFTEELVRYSLIWTGFIGAAYAFSTREHMSLTLVRDKFTGKAHTALLVAIDGLILLLAIFVITIGGFKLAIFSHNERQPAASSWLFLPAVNSPLCWASPAVWCTPSLRFPAFSSSSPRSSTFMKISPAKKLTAKEGTEQ